MTEATKEELQRLLLLYQNTVNQLQIEVSSLRQYVFLLENTIRGHSQEEIETWEERSHLH